MSDMPERISAWAWNNHTQRGQWSTMGDLAGEQDYIRADLHDAVTAERDALRAEVERLTSRLSNQNHGLAELVGRLERLNNAAQAVLDRWDSPSWADAGPTAAVMADLRAALGDNKP